MRYLLTCVVLAAAASPITSAAVIGSREAKGSVQSTLGPAPYETVDMKDNVPFVDLDLSDYDGFEYDKTSDLYRCHGTCGKLMGILEAKCDHPFAKPFRDYCLVGCEKAAPKAVYPRAKKLAKECDSKLAGKVPASEESKVKETPTTQAKDEKAPKPEANNAKAPEPEAKKEKANEDEAIGETPPEPAAENDKKAPIPGVKSDETSESAKSAPSASATNIQTTPATAASTTPAADTSTPVVIGKPGESSTAASPSSDTSTSNGGNRPAATTRPVEVTNDGAKIFNFATAITVATLAMLAVYY